ncbi:MAG TPA: nucleoside-diphosphate sugar epimerase/dehydratase [Nitrospira sp.]|jgi:FlaA1/EpsC-like NDP-sugar epimerase|nr:nucleoside-diphosphate sugar epimerase/dehydratase [Nitrospira sp.]HNI68190.1 nucleoside-diphosphate sugar epimerase/dehydratase [Nitrospira sp.]HNL20668.1 nucleoside-diphosphate sugar epimerase/dehydratase [Rhodocyclaceae bacterium]HNL88102.1 nucleoside-diphosphate sugar epimerase/dehydratase [Nitrospira sp.]HNN40820.1 nucleoside-diphosphate sugar epimerase/dehydratase [Nitrospira sp.]
MTNSRTLAAFLHDLFAVAAAWMVAFWLRFNFDVPVEYLAAAQQSLVWVIPLFGALFFAFGLYQGVWRFASLADMRHILAAVGTGAVLLVMAVLFLRPVPIPRSVLVMHPLLLVAIMGGSRFAYRSWKEHRLYGPARMRGQPVIVLGAGEAADSLLREMSRSGLWYAVAVVSKKQSNQGRRLHGLPVFAPMALLPEVAKRYSVKHVIMAMPNSRAAERRDAAEIAASAGLTVMTMPSYDDLLAGRVSVSSIRRVELEDLLGREAVSLDDAGLHDLLSGRVVLVTGAGGSIGSELCRQIGKFSPARLALVESSEFALYQIDEELALSFPGLARTCWAADVRDCERADEILAAEKPAVIFHAAAYKHVPLMEADNAWQAVRTNALGTLTMARAAQRAEVEKFVLISTDKAVNPTNVMGATKRLAERLCRAIQRADGTCFVTVRFGNVLGSNGSVIPKFREQIARGGPVTVTHPDIVRYFMTIPEAAQLVLQAGLMGRGGEIFVLDMGEPVRIADLARDMIRLSGFPEDEIPIRYSGLRPGEKLYEELLADDESTLPTPHPKLRIARLADSLSESEFDDIQRWLAAGVRDVSQVRAGLKRFVPEYVLP